MPEASPLSAFVTDMRAAFARRLRAQSEGEKHGAEQAIEEIMRRYLGRSAWDAASVEMGRTIACVPASEPPVVDRKTLAAGPEAE